MNHGPKFLWETVDDGQNEFHDTENNFWGANNCLSETDLKHEYLKPRNAVFCRKNLLCIHNLHMHVYNSHLFCSSALSLSFPLSLSLTGTGLWYSKYEKICFTISLTTKRADDTIILGGLTTSLVYAESNCLFVRLSNGALFKNIKDKNFKNIIDYQESRWYHIILRGGSTSFFVN